jgi:hypothetical protein
LRRLADDPLQLGRVALAGCLDDDTLRAPNRRNSLRSKDLRSKIL